MAFGEPWEVAMAAKRLANNAPGVESSCERPTPSGRTFFRSTI